MCDTVPGSDVLPLLRALTQLRRLTLGGFNRKQFCCTKTQLTVFTVLYLNGSLTMSQVAEYLSSSNEQATRAVAPLVDAGYVERFTDPNNRTKVHVRLTEAGRTYLEPLGAEFQSYMDRRLDRSLSKKDRRRLLRAAETLVQLVSQVV